MRLRNRTRLSLVAVTLVLLAVAAIPADGSRKASPIPAAHDLAITSSPRGHWLNGLTISEYWPVPESWFRGELVSAPGISGKHRVDWLYSGIGLVMEGDGITLGGRRVHVDDFGNEQWVNARGQRTTPTASGVWTHGDPAWRVGGWRNARGAVTFPLEKGGWSNGPAMRYAPVPRRAVCAGPVAAAEAVLQHRRRPAPDSGGQPHLHPGVPSHQRRLVRRSGHGQRHHRAPHRRLPPAAARRPTAAASSSTSGCSSCRSPGNSRAHGVSRTTVSDHRWQCERLSGGLRCAVRVGGRVARSRAP